MDKMEEQGEGGAKPGSNKLHRNKKRERTRRAYTYVVMIHRKDCPERGSCEIGSSTVIDER